MNTDTHESGTSSEEQLARQLMNILIDFALHFTLP